MMDIVESLIVPPHVPPHLVRDLDLFDLPGMQADVFAAWKKVSETSPGIFYAPRYGGRWVIADAEIMEETAQDYERFSSTDSLGVPHVSDWVALPIEADPPFHQFYRRPINLAVSPKALVQLTADARQLAVQLIEGFLARGECSFIEEFSQHLPVQIFLQIMGLPLSDREWLMKRAEVMTRGNDPVQRMAAVREINGYLAGWMEKRRAKPGEDLLSKIIEIKIDGRPISDEEVLSEASLVLFGGLDTVAGSMGFVAWFLATHDQHRRALVAEPSLIPQAIMEMLRRHTLPGISRRVRNDISYHGVEMKAGDLVLMVECMHGLDQRKWQDPLTVDFHRDLSSVMVFGKGAHFCPGALLARAELKVYLEEWLQRIPEFHLKEGTFPVMSSGNVMGIQGLQLAWDVAA